MPIYWGGLVDDPNDRRGDQDSPPVTLRLRPDRRRTQRGIPEINRRHDDWIWAATSKNPRDGEDRPAAGPPSPRSVN